MAEGAGFEPAIRSPAYTLSKRAPSATRPPLRIKSRNADRVRRSGGRKLTEPAQLRNGYDALMRILFYGGMVLVIFGLLAAAVETGTRGLYSSDPGFFMSAYDLWSSLRPKSLVIFEIRTERIAPWLWNPVLLSVLKFPAWAIFGLPGALIVWFAHPGRNRGGPDDIQEVMESFELFDDLTRLARKENPKGEEHGPHDILPDNLPDEDLAPDADAPDKR